MKKQRRSNSKKLEVSFKRSIDEHTKAAAEVFKDLLKKIETKFKLVTPKSPCCNAPTFNQSGSTICTKCARPIQTTI